MAFDIVASKALFTCRKCGVCCKGYGGTYVTGRDIQRISQFIGLAPQKFVDQFCVLSGNRPLLKQSKDNYCIFWHKLCTIHPVKPLMCRKWPFLESILADPVNWFIMADSCPGIKTDISMHELEKFVKQMILINWNF